MKRTQFSSSGFQKESSDERKLTGTGKYNFEEDYEDPETFNIGMPPPSRGHQEEEEDDYYEDDFENVRNAFLFYFKL
jgi:hypothetical protein